MRKLSIVHTESSTGWGGQEIRILTEIHGFLARGHKVKLVCPADAELVSAAAQYGIDVIALPIGRKNLDGLFAITRWLRENANQIEVINTHSSTDSWLVAIALSVLRLKKPTVRTRHVSTTVNRSVATRWLYQNATNHIVTTGEALRQQLHQENGYALDSMTSVPTGIDLNRFRPLDRASCKKKIGLDENLKFIGIVATLRDWKGHSYLFDAMVSIATIHPTWHLLVIGDGPYEQKLREKVNSLQLRDHVTFVGRQNNIPEWLNAIELFVLPSYGDEGVPQSIIQAMACGLPVVSTPIGSIEEAVLHGVTGLVVPPRDSDAIASAITKLIGNPALRRQFGEAGHARAHEQFAFDLMIDRMESIFTHAIECH